MKIPCRRVATALLTVLLASTVACGPPDDPELVALAYQRAVNSGDPDTAVDMLDTGRILSRVEEQVVVVDSSGKETFLEDSIETLLWALFRETRPVDLAYDATPATIDGDSAQVSVTKTSADGASETVLVHLRRTDDGWRVSGESVEVLVTYVVQRLQERY